MNPVPLRRRINSKWCTPALVVLLCTPLCFPWLPYYAHLSASLGCPTLHTSQLPCLSYFAHLSASLFVLLCTPLCFPCLSYYVHLSRFVLLCTPLCFPSLFFPVCPIMHTSQVPSLSCCAHLSASLVLPAMHTSLLPLFVLLSTSLFFPCLSYYPHLSASLFDLLSVIGRVFFFYAHQLVHISYEWLHEKCPASASVL